MLIGLVLNLVSYVRYLMNCFFLWGKEINCFEFKKGGRGKLFVEKL